MNKAFLIDFDDTLCYTNSVFNRIREEFNALMQSWGMQDDDLNRIMNDFDIDNVHKLGHFSNSCFPDAFGQTYEFYCKRFHKPLQQTQKEQVISLGYSVFEQPIELMPDAVWLLKQLKKDYKLYLITHGDIATQKKRVARSGLTPYFNNIYIIEKKSLAEYQNIINDNNIDTSCSWMLGNSLRYDIDLALKAGLNAIHLISDSWDFDLCEVKKIYLEVSSLKMVVSLIKE